MRQPAYFWPIVIIGAVLAGVAIVAGFWMLAPFVVAGILLMTLVRTHRSRHDRI